MAHINIFLPRMLVVMPTPKSLGVNHSFTSSLDVSKTHVGKFAARKNVTKVRD